ncbi:MAG TPA: PD-(D/E)XK nuclease family protein [Chloroflexota bacterium]|nr:PD-(D/E)XK nuclease family protein [Chloroflexota bacterium]
MIVPHWSCSRFMAWDICPGEYRARYVLERPVIVTEALAFGQAMHHALESHYTGQDGERAFRHFWREEQLHVDGGVSPRLTSTGLRLLDQVFELGLHGTPERGFEIDTNADLLAPIVGAIDLSDDTSGTVFDFKTTQGRWSQDRAQTEVWQPLIYTWAEWERTSQLFDFEYVVMDRSRGTVSRFRREHWSPDQWLAQMNVAWLRMQFIAAHVRADQFDCPGQHGFCPECGGRWSHDHECDTLPRRIRL